MFKCLLDRKLQIRVDEHKAAVKNVKTVDSKIVWNMSADINTRLICNLFLFLPVNVDISTLESWFIRKSSTSSCEA